MSGNLKGLETLGENLGAVGEGARFHGRRPIVDTGNRTTILHFRVAACPGAQQGNELRTLIQSKLIVEHQDSFRNRHKQTLKVPFLSPRLISIQTQTAPRKWPIGETQTKTQEISEK